MDTTKVCYFICAALGIELSNAKSLRAQLEAAQNYQTSSPKWQEYAENFGTIIEQHQNETRVVKP